MTPRVGSRARVRKGRSGPGGRGGPAGRVSCPEQASGRHSGLAAGALGRDAGRRPTLAGNVSPGDAAPGGERGAAAAAATVRASAARERTCGAAKGSGGSTAGLGGPAGAGNQDAGAGGEVGPGRGAQQRAGPPPSGGAAGRGSMLGSGAARPR